MLDTPDVSVSLKVEPLVVSVTNASRLLGLCKATTYTLINSGALETTQIGKRRLVRMSSIRRLAGETA